jgi:hypothetical protein
MPIHYAPRGFLQVDCGLLTASQVLDLNADSSNKVSIRFFSEIAYAQQLPIG